MIDMPAYDAKVRVWPTQVRHPDRKNRKRGDAMSAPGVQNGAAAYGRFLVADREVVWSREWRQRLLDGDIALADPAGRKQAVNVDDLPPDEREAALAAMKTPAPTRTAPSATATTKSEG